MGGREKCCDNQRHQHLAIVVYTYNIRNFDRELMILDDIMKFLFLDYPILTCVCAWLRMIFKV